MEFGDVVYASYVQSLQTSNLWPEASRNGLAHACWRNNRLDESTNCKYSSKA